MFGRSDRCLNLGNDRLGVYGRLLVLRIFLKDVFIIIVMRGLVGVIGWEAVIITFFKIFMFLVIIMAVLY